MKFLVCVTFLCIFGLVSMTGICDASCDDTCHDPDSGTTTNCYKCAESDYVMQVADPEGGDHYGPCVFDVTESSLLYTWTDAYSSETLSSGDYDRDNVPPGFFRSGDLYALVACDATCEGCTGAATQCTECCTDGWCLATKNFEYLQRESVNAEYGSCVESCPDGYYLDDDCIKCHSDCSVCYGGTAWDCIKCASETKEILALQEKDSITGMCIEECINGAYDQDLLKCYLEGECPFGADRDGKYCKGTYEKYPTCCGCSS